MKDFKIICFIGPDGSGKSTLAKILFNDLNSRNFSTAYTWWLEGETTYLRRLVRKIGGLKRVTRFRSRNVEFEISTSNVKKNSIETLIKRAYLKFVLYEYVRFGKMKFFNLVNIQSKHILIFDRFMYDIVLFLSDEFEMDPLEKEMLMKRFASFLPEPDIVFLIDVKPHISYSRKSHEILSEDIAKKVWDNYHDFYSFITEVTPGKIVRIDNSRPLELVSNEIKNYVENYLAERK